MEKTTQECLNDLRNELVSIRESGVNAEALAETMCDAIIAFLDTTKGHNLWQDSFDIRLRKTPC